jgi:hypothetical protein
MSDWAEGQGEFGACCGNRTLLSCGITDRLFAALPSSTPKPSSTEIPLSPMWILIV